MSMFNLSSDQSPSVIVLVQHANAPELGVQVDTVQACLAASAHTVLSHPRLARQDTHIAP